MKKYTLFILLSFLIMGIKSKGQPIIGISPYSAYIANDTLPGGSSDSVSMWVVNSGTSVFNDYIYLITYVQDSSGAFYHVVDTTSSVFPITLAVGDSTPFYLYPFYDVVTPNKYHYDINVIVIWPIAESATTGDIFTYDVFLTLPNGVDEIDLTQVIKAYPNPTSNNLTIENTSKKAIEEVRIYDTHSRLIQHLTKPEFICTEGWSKGIYLINIQLEGGKTHTIRVVKQ